MIHPVKIYDKDGNLKREGSSETLTKRSVKTLNDIHNPNRRFGVSRATFKVFTCKNCGVKIRSKKEKAEFCSTYCSGYWTKTVATGHGSAFRFGGLDAYPEAKAELALRINAKAIYDREGYQPIKRGRNGI